MQLERKQDWSQTALIYIGLMKMTLLLMFFASFLAVKPADATQANACVGKNLLIELESERPSAYETVISQGAEVTNAESIFWKIEKDGLAPSWLYGTMHMSDPRISTIPEDAKDAILASETLVVESVDALDPQATMNAMASLTHLTMLQDGTLRDLVIDDLEDELAEAVATRGLSIEIADRMQPWLIATMVSLPVCEIQRKTRGERVLDQVLADFAKDNNRSVKGLETTAEQLEAIASLPAEFHIAALEETLMAGSRALDMIETMKILYLEEKINLVFPLMRIIMPETGNAEGMAEFQEALITKRNLTMVERARPILAGGSSFIAVGALHLPGDDGMVNLLRKEGFKVTTAR
ncbi:MAG: TraB/GumN family protein [Pseudomonadota bacterium]